MRDLDRTWRISPAGKYLIEFDMDHASMKATLLTTVGTGTETNPLQIANKLDLQSLRDRMADGRTTYARLTADIDMQGEGWWPLNSTFYANSTQEGYGKAISLDGQGHIISNLTIADSKENGFEAGFFGALVGSVENLGLYNASVRSSLAQNVGLLAGLLGTDEEAATVAGSYFHGSVVTEGAGTTSASGAVAGVAVNATVENVYANAFVSSDGVMGDFIGIGSPQLTVRHSYSAGKANGSEGTAAIADEQESSVQDFLFFDGENQDEICQTVSQWEGWNENGQVGQGWPLLQWQVERGDHARFCGFGSLGDLNGDGTVDIADAVSVLNIMAEDGFTAAADLNGDGKVDIADFVSILNIMAEQ